LPELLINTFILLFLDYLDMSKAKCFRCGATATANTFEQASKQLDHSVGLSRGIKCGDNYNRVQEIKDTQKTKSTTKTDVNKTKIAEPQTDSNPEYSVTSEKVKEKKTKSKK